MFKKWLAFSGLVALVVALDPALTPAQPPGGFGRPRDGNGFGGPGGPGGPPFGGYGGPPGGGMGGPPQGGWPGGGMGGPPGGGFGGGNGGMGGGRRGMDPEKGWAWLQNLTGSTGDTVDLSKIPAQTAGMLRNWAVNSGGKPLPETGIMTKAAYFEFQAQSEAQRASLGGGGPNGNGGGWGQGGWNQQGGGWGQGGWNQQGGDPNAGRGVEKKVTEEEKPVAMRYGKLPKDLPAWFEELDTDKDGQIGFYEWRAARRDAKEFMDMDLNGDGLVTADEYLRFTRQQSISEKVEAYQNGERPAGNFGLGEKLDAKAGDNTKGPGRGPGPGGPGPGGPGPGGGWNKGGDNSKGGGGWPGPGGGRGGNPRGNK
jgi:hypothetical protein